MALGLRVTAALLREPDAREAATVSGAKKSRWVVPALCGAGRGAGELELCCCKGRVVARRFAVSVFLDVYIISDVFHVP